MSLLAILPALLCLMRHMRAILSNERSPLPKPQIDYTWTLRRFLQRSKRRKQKSKVDVIAPQVEQAYGLEPQTAQGQLETSYLLFLALVFAIIILEGLFIATSVSLTVSSIDTLLLHHAKHDCALSVLSCLDKAIGVMVAVCRASSQRPQTDSPRMWFTRLSHLL